MLETYNVVLIHSVRNLKKNMVSSPVLYLLFGSMMVFSIVLLGYLTLFLMKTEVPLDIDDVFLVIVFLFVLKASYDFYNYFTKSEPLTYVLSTGVSHRVTVFEVFLVVFWVQLGLWVFFSSLYTSTLVGIGINPSYVVVYLKFTCGVMLASVLGVCFVLHYFSSKKYRLLPFGGIFAVLWYWNDLMVVVVLLGCAVVYLVWSMTYALDSFQYVPRKNRKKEETQVWLQSPRKAVFYKEITTLWRERVLFSMIFSSVVMGAGAGYIARFGTENLLPASLQVLAARIAPESYAFFGIYVLTIHGAVFISLSLFLNEEQTLWLLHHLPVSMKTIVVGKALALCIPFVCSLPFLAYYLAFTGGESFVFLAWFLVFSYIAGVILCFPLGAKYVGRKSDILLLYSVSLVIFIILGFMFSLNSVLPLFGASPVALYGVVTIIEVVLLWVSLQVSAKVLSLKYSSIVQYA
jgi:hypothetical protein